MADDDGSKGAGRLDSLTWLRQRTAEADQP